MDSGEGSEGRGLGRGEAAIGLGSNLGDRIDHLRSAVAGLGKLGRVVGLSSLYETSPIGGPPQGDYLNAVVILATDLDPDGLVAELKALEQRSGRRPTVRYGPRILDLDLLLLGVQEHTSRIVTVPHPRLTERRFVLEPLLEVRPDAALPSGAGLADLRDAVADQEVRLVQGPNWAE